MLRALQVPGPGTRALTAPQLDSEDERAPHQEAADPAPCEGRLALGRGRSRAAPGPTRAQRGAVDRPVDGGAGSYSRLHSVLVRAPHPADLHLDLQRAR